MTLAWPSPEDIRITSRHAAVGLGRCNVIIGIHEGKRFRALQSRGYAISAAADRFHYEMTASYHETPSPGKRKAFNNFPGFRPIYITTDIEPRLP